MEKTLIYDFKKGECCNATYGREPIIEIMPDKSLICVITTGGPTEPHNDNVVVILKSTDNGKTWTKPELLFSHKDRGVWATEIYSGFEKPMLVLYTYNANCPAKELQTFVSYTEDCGKTWSEPTQIAPFANGMCLRKGIKMSNGETLFPVYFTETYKNFGEFKKFGEPDFWEGTRYICAAVVTSDNGRTYTPYGNFKIEIGTRNDISSNSKGNFGTSLHLWEPNCVEAENGHIVMYMRDSGASYMNCAESFDYGRTWSHIGMLDNIPNANSKLAMQKIKDKVLLVFNNVESLEYGERKNLSIWISDDGLKNWKEVCLVGTKDEHLFYPHMTVDEENEIVYLAYENAGQHYLNKYTYEELNI